MGHHYVPQRHLRKFGIVGHPGMIYMFDKKLGVATKASIAKVAQEPEYYTAEVEEKLSKLVEVPGGNAIDKLIGEHEISEGERLDLSVHIATMLKRVPHRRLKAYRLIPSVVEQMRRDMPQQLAELEQMRGYPAPNPQKELEEADRILDRFRDNLPEPFETLIRTPWPTPDMVEAIMAMTWRIFKAPKSDFFITSDNPVVFFEEITLSGQLAELVFPMSPQYALHGCLQPERINIVHVNANRTAVRIVNRRIANGVTRFAFCHERAEWILTLIRKQNLINPLRFVPKIGRP